MITKEVLYKRTYSTFVRKVASAGEGGSDL